ncbi:MAG: flavin reductase family protein [Planctomycetes bacterium]|nr:flavin reductase family protein [Planctomycetota bacterium]
MAQVYDALTYGCYVVTTAWKGKRYGMTCCWATQTGPETILFCLGDQSSTKKAILKSRVFGVNVLARGQKDLALRFGEGRSEDEDKFRGAGAREGKLGVPLLPGCVKTVECRVVKGPSIEGEALIAGRIVDFRRGRAKGGPLLLDHVDRK